MVLIYYCLVESGGINNPILHFSIIIVEEVGEGGPGEQTRLQICNGVPMMASA